MRFLIDSDLLLEAILNRPNLFRETSLVWDIVESNSDIEAYVVESGLDRIISITRSLMTSEVDADEATALVQSIVNIAYVDSEKLQSARNLGLKDFESAIELVCAEAYSATAIVTHRAEEFEGLDYYPVQIWSIRNFLEFVKLERSSALSLEPSQKLDANAASISLEKCFIDDNQVDREQYLQHFFINRNRSILRNYSSQTKTSSNLPQVAFQNFVGRSKELDHLLSFLRTDSHCKVISVCGEVGVGKSSLVLLAAQLCEEAKHLGEHSCLPIYDAFIFIPSIWNISTLDSSNSVSQTPNGEYLTYLARVIAFALCDDSINRISGDDRLKRIYSRLSRQKTLLILDGLDCIEYERDEIERFLKYLPGNTKAIITSRQDDFGYRRLDLARFHDSESMLIIRRIAEDSHLILREDETIQICQHCLGNPLVINMVALQYTNYPGSLTWRNNSCSSVADLFQLLTDTLLKHLKSKYSKILLLGLAFARNSFDLEVLTHMIGLDPKSELKVRKSLAELCRLSLIIETGRRYSLNPIVQELVLLFTQQHPEITRSLYKRVLKAYIRLTEKYGGTDWGDWYVTYDFLDAEWGNLQSVIQSCLFSGDYQSVKQLWKHLNHFADLYGYWSDRVRWLDSLIELSQLNRDTAGYVFALSRKAWTLVMINNPDSLAEAEPLLKEAWDLRREIDPENQNYLAHHRVIFYIRCKRYQEAEQALEEQKDMLNVLQGISIDDRVLIRHELNFLRNRAKLDYELENLEQARKQFEVVLQKAEEINWLRGVCYVHNKLANIALRQQDLMCAEKHLVAGLPIAKRNRNKRRLAGYEESFAQLEKLRGDGKAAQRWAVLAAHHYSVIGRDNESKTLIAAFIKNDKLLLKDSEHE
jgi:NB-ARC domain